MIDKRRKSRTHLFVFLLPAVLIYTAFMIYPLINTVQLSFFSVKESGEAPIFVGLSNFVALLTNPIWSDRFFGALKNNFFFFLIHMLVQNPIGLFLAGLLTIKKLRFRSTYRTVFFLPTMLSVVIIGFVWQLILSPLWGVSEGLLSGIGLGSLFQPWLGLENYALVFLALISVWQFVGIPMLLFYAVLIGIPEELIEAARIDGANDWTIFWRIKFPLILPIIAIISILTFIGNFNAFDLIYTTQGALAGPNYASDLLGTFFYRVFFGHRLQLGDPTLGAGVASLMLIIILAGVAVYLLWRKRIKTYEL